jgi:hypothetical protein
MRKSTMNDSNEAFLSIGALGTIKLAVYTGAPLLSLTGTSAPFGGTQPSARITCKSKDRFSACGSNCHCNWRIDNCIKSIERIITRHMEKCSDRKTKWVRALKKCVGTATWLLPMTSYETTSFPSSVRRGKNKGPVTTRASPHLRA